MALRERLERGGAHHLGEHLLARAFNSQHCPASWPISSSSISTWSFTKPESFSGIARKLQCRQFGVMGKFPQVHGHVVGVEGFDTGTCEAFGANLGG